MKALFLNRMLVTELSGEVKEFVFPKTFNNGMPAECHFKNGWSCSKCGKTTEHYIKHPSDVQRCVICDTPTHEIILPPSFLASIHIPIEMVLLQDWSVLELKGIDYTESFGRDRENKIVIQHHCTYRKIPSNFRKDFECGVWVDGKQILGYAEMLTQKVLNRRNLE